MEVWDHSSPEGQTLLQETIMEHTQRFTAHPFCQHQNAARHRTEKSIFTATRSALFSAVQYWGWFTWVWCKFNASIKLLNGAGALCICRYDHNAARQTTAFWPKPRSQTSRILTWFGKSRDFIWWPVLIIYGGGQFELAEGLVGIIQVQVILKIREWVCSHGPQTPQFVYFTVSKTRTAEIVRWDTEITNLPPHRDTSSSHRFPPNTPSSLLIQRLCLLPLNTSRNSSSSSSPEAQHIRFFHANCYQRPSRAVPTLSRNLCLTTALGRTVFLSWNRSSTRTLQKATGCTSPCLIHSLYGSELPLPPNGWHKARLFPQLAQYWNLSQESPPSFSP